MKQLVRMLVSLLASFNAGAVWAQGPKYPPLSEYMMPPGAEIALARSAAPANISDRATIKVLTTSGYQVARDGDNGFVCMVMHAWAAPTYTPRSAAKPRLRCNRSCAYLLQAGGIANRSAVLRAAKQAGDGGQSTGPDRRSCSSGLCQRRTSKERCGLIWLHVVCRPAARTWRPLASAHDGLCSLLRQLDDRW